MSKPKFNMVLRELRQLLSQVDESQVEKLVQAIVEAKHVFIAGAGRSGYVIRTFAMRLMQLGLRVFVAGETTCPAIGEGDLLILASASGETPNTLGAAMVASTQEAQVASITARPSSTLAKVSDLTIVLPAPSRVSPRSPKDRKTKGKVASAQPPGSLFEQGLLIFFETVVMLLMDRLGQSAHDLLQRHANLE